MLTGANGVVATNGVNGAVGDAGTNGTPGAKGAQVGMDSEWDFDLSTNTLDLLRVPLVLLVTLAVLARLVFQA